MTTSNQPNPTIEIIIQGHLATIWDDAFEPLRLVSEFSPQGAPITRLVGPLEDQAALHGILTRIRELGLTLISVNQRP